MSNSEKFFGTVGFVTCFYLACKAALWIVTACMFYVEHSK